MAAAPIAALPAMLTASEGLAAGSLMGAGLAGAAAPAAAGALGAGAGGAGLLGGALPFGSSLPELAMPQAMAALGAPTPEKFLAPTMLGQMGQFLDPIRKAQQGMSAMNQLTGSPQPMPAPQQNMQLPRPMASSGPMPKVPSPIEIAAYKRQMRRQGRV